MASGRQYQTFYDDSGYFLSVFLCTIDFYAALRLFRLTNQIQSDLFSVHTAVKQTHLTHMGPRSVNAHQ